MILKTPIPNLLSLPRFTAAVPPPVVPLFTTASPKDFRGEATGRIVAPLVAGGRQVGVVLECDGTATHLGRYRRSEEIRFGEDGALAGDFVLRSAHGDELHIRFEGRMVSPCEARGTYEIAGGRGRFQSVFGEAEVVVTVDGSHVSMVFEGSISF